MLAAIRFKVTGNRRFLSHAETSEVFRRACARAALEVRYSQGFNPRPRLRLPLPRTVGVQSEEDLLCLDLSDEAGTDLDGIKGRIEAQLPDGFELTGITRADSKAAFVPLSAVYVFDVAAAGSEGQLEQRTAELLAADSVEIHRSAGPRKRGRTVDVRRFLRSIRIERIDPGTVRVTAACACGPGGSIRVDEIIKLLDLDAAMIEGPVRRTSVQWQQNN